MALNSSFLFFSIIILLFFFPLFFSPILSLSNHNHLSASDPPRAMLFEEKTRLGSTPPSCYNKCNQCHPCTAVQVPTLPSLHRVQTPSSASQVAIFEYDSASGYSNYKPLGWKCRCKDHFYNP